MRDHFDEPAGLGDLIAQLSAAARREGSAMVIGEPTPPELVAATNALAKRVMRRVRRLELLSAMGGIEPTDVRGALVGIWRN
jgi:FAD synthase